MRLQRFPPLRILFVFTRMRLPLRAGNSHVRLPVLAITDLKECGATTDLLAEDAASMKSASTCLVLKLRVLSIHLCFLSSLNIRQMFCRREDGVELVKRTKRGALNVVNADFPLFRREGPSGVDRGLSR